MKRRAGGVNHQRCRILENEEFNFVHGLRLGQLFKPVLSAEPPCDRFFDDLLTVGHGKQLAFYAVSAYGESVVF